MPTARHTPGEWQRVVLRATEERKHEQIVSLGRGVLLIEHDGSPEGEANAALATAAPKLLAALEQIAARFVDRDDETGRWYQDFARAAIRAASREEG